MRSILFKDFLEQRMYFCIILAVAVVSLLVAAYFNQLDAGVALMLLFGMQGPLFVYMAAHHQISSEISNRTFPFLASLPISRFRLWLAKFIFVSIYTAALYGFYLVLAYICGADINGLIKSLNYNPILIIGIPLTIMTYGFYTTMLPQGFSTIAFLILAPFLFVLGLVSVTVRTINVELALVFLSILFVALSLLIFMRDKSMNSPWRGVKGLVFLVIGITLMTGFWATLDKLAEKSWTVMKDESMSWVPTNDGKSVLWTLRTAPCWWDVIDVKGFGTRLFLHNLETGEIKQVGQRNSSMSSYNAKFNQGFATIQNSKIWAGFLRGVNYAIVDENGMIVKDLPVSVDDYSQSFKLIDDKRFIYSEEVKTDKNVITEFHLYEKGRGDKVVFSAQEDFAFSHYLIMPDKDRTRPAYVAIAGMSDREKGKLVLISAADGKRKVLSVPPTARLVFSSSSYVVYDEGQWNKKTHERDIKLSLVDLDGKVESLAWLGEKTKLVGISAAGKLLVLDQGVLSTDWYGTRWQRMVEMDPVDKSVKELLQFPFPSDATVELSAMADKALVSISIYNKSEDSRKTRLFAVNLETGEAAEFDSLRNYFINGLKSLSGNRFLVDNYDQGFIADVGSMTAKLAFSQSNFLDRLEKGGVTK